MAKTKESKLEQQVAKFMQQRGIWQLARFQAQSNQNGLPDRIYLYKGVLLGFELKTDTGTPTDLQLKKLKAICDNGGVGAIIRDVNTVKEIIDCIDVFMHKYPKVDVAQYLREDLGEFYEDY